MTDISHIFDISQHEQNELMRWKEVTKTTAVPLTRPSDEEARKVWSKELANWVHYQRTSQGPKKNSDRWKKLDDIDFIWSKLNADWEERFNELKRWKEDMKTTHVPEKKPSDKEARKVWSKELAYWGNNQKKRLANWEDNQGSRRIPKLDLTETGKYRWEKLNTLGFWD